MFVSVVDKKYETLKRNDPFSDDYILNKYPSMSFDLGKFEERRNNLNPQLTDYSELLFYNPRNNRLFTLVEDEQEKEKAILDIKKTFKVDNEIKTIYKYQDLRYGGVYYVPILKEAFNYQTVNSELSYDRKNPNLYYLEYRKLYINEDYLEALPTDSTYDRQIINRWLDCFYITVLYYKDYVIVHHLDRFKRTLQTVDNNTKIKYHYTGISFKIYYKKSINCCDWLCGKI